MVDAVTIFLPAAVDIALAPYGTSDGSVGVSSLSTVRIIRLSKLVRLLRSSRIYRRWESRITINSSTITIIKVTLLLTLGTHW